MEMFKRELTVGGKALVIGVNHPENIHLIGMVVTVEEICDGPKSVESYLSEKGRKVVMEYGWGWFYKENTVVVSGNFKDGVYEDSFAGFNRNHLMPLDNDGTMIEQFKEETNPYLETV